MPTDKSAEAYLTTKVMTASQEELRLLLIDGAIKFTKQGRHALANKDFAGLCDGFSRSRDIILELVNSMRPEVAPELCKNVAGLYMFMYRLLVEAGLERDLAKADKVIELLEYERETWILLMEKLAKERAGAAAVRQQHAEPASAPMSPAYSPLSVAG